ncbi:MAG TPA: hypothetical protein VLC47_09855 [Burkholderiales bacterium]|nr:hypothetical protein [Burkholderiales bacterium]
MSTDARTDATAPPCRLEEEEDRSIGTAMRATFCFLAIVLLLLWAGMSDAARAAAEEVSAVTMRSG